MRTILKLPALSQASEASQARHGLAWKPKFNSGYSDELKRAAVNVVEALWGHDEIFDNATIVRWNILVAGTKSRCGTLARSRLSQQ
jgi:hypothetical protein